MIQKKMMTIAIAEDNGMAREAVLSKLAPYTDVQVAVLAANGSELVSGLAGREVDLVLMDIEMPLMNGIEATRQVREQYPGVKVVMLTTFDDEEKLFDSILAGASGYLLKDEPGEELYRAMGSTLSGGASMSASIALKTLHFIRESGRQSTEPCILSERELEILQGLKSGRGYKQVAAALNISEGTVRKHVENIYRKLEVNNKVSAINLAEGKRWLA